MWRTAAATGADLLWRVHANRATPAGELPDGSWLAQLAPGRDRRAEHPLLSGSWTTRSTTADDRDGRLPAVHDDARPRVAPAAGLAVAYAQRWEIESAFDELKTHQRGPRIVLRSKSPDLVLQEIWGHLCCHYAIRTLMAEAAEHAGHDPDRVSFTAALRIARQTIAHRAPFPPHTAREPAPRSGAPLGLTRPLNPARRPRISTPRRQTQVHQVARQTRRPRQLATTTTPPQYNLAL